MRASEHAYRPKNKIKSLFAAALMFAAFCAAAAGQWFLPARSAAAAPAEYFANYGEWEMSVVDPSPMPADYFGFTVGENALPVREDGINDGVGTLSFNGTDNLWHKAVVIPIKKTMTADDGDTLYIKYRSTVNAAKPDTPDSYNGLFGTPGKDVPRLYLGDPIKRYPNNNTWGNGDGSGTNGQNGRAYCVGSDMFTNSIDDGEYSDGYRLAKYTITDWSAFEAGDNLKINWDNRGAISGTFAIGGIAVGSASRRPDFATDKEVVKDTVNVTLRAGDGAGTNIVLPDAADKNQAYTLPAYPASFTPPQYMEFAGWHDGNNSNGDNPYPVGAEYPVGTANLTFTAVYTLQAGMIEVRYLPGGAPGEAKMLAAPRNSNVTLIENPFTWSNHEFRGWKAGGGDDVFDAGYEYAAGTENLTFTAQWEEVIPPFEPGLEFEPVGDGYAYGTNPPSVITNDGMLPLRASYRSIFGGMYQFFIKSWDGEETDITFSVTSEKACNLRVNNILINARDEWAVSRVFYGAREGIFEGSWSFDDRDGKDIAAGETVSITVTISTENGYTAGTDMEWSVTNCIMFCFDSADNIAGGSSHAGRQNTVDIDASITGNIPKPPADAVSYDYDEETISLKSGYEAAADEDGFGSPIADGSSVSGYIGETIYVRLGKVGLYGPGEPDAFTVPSRHDTPVKGDFMPFITKNAISFSETGYLYSRDGTTFTPDSFSASGLEDDTEYTFYIKKAATAAAPGVQGMFASEAAELAFSTLVDDGRFPEPPDSAMSIDFENETIVFDAAFETSHGVTLEASFSEDFPDDGEFEVTPGVTKIAPGTEVFFRVKADSEMLASRAKSKTAPVRRDAPSAPPYTPASDSITFTTAAGEYLIALFEDGTPLVYGTGRVFDGLEPETEYTFYFMLPHTGSEYVSEANFIVITTYTEGGVPLPPSDTVVTRNYRDETFTFNSDMFEVSGEEDFSELVYTDSTRVVPGETYYVRYKAVGQAPASAAAVFQLSGRLAPPPGQGSADALEPEISDTAIAFSGTGYEYKLGNNGVWTANGVFDELTLGTEYVVSIKTAATEGTAGAAGMFASLPVEYTVKTTDTRPALSKSDVVINYIEETMTFVETLEVSEDEDFGTVLVSGTTIVTPGAAYYIRYKQDGGQPAGAAYRFQLDARPAPPPVQGSADELEPEISDTAITFSGAGYEYRFADGGDWGTDGVFDGLTLGTEYTFEVRRAAAAGGQGADGSFASASVEYTIETTDSRPAAPGETDYTIDYTEETFRYNIDVFEVSRSAAFEGALAPGFRLTPGEKIFMRARAAGTRPAGRTLEITIKTRLDGPSEGALSDRTVKMNSVAFKSTGFEYKLLTEPDSAFRTDGTFNMLSADEYYTFVVRIPATASSFCSSGTNISIKTNSLSDLRAAPDNSVVTLNYLDKTLSFDTAAYEASKSSDFRANMTFASGNPVEPGQTIYVRLLENDDEDAGQALAYSVPARASAPEMPSPELYEDALIFSAAGLLYRLDNGEWSESGEFRGLAPATAYTVYWKTPGSASNFESEAGSFSVETLEKGSGKAPLAGGAGGGAGRIPGGQLAGIIIGSTLGGLVLIAGLLFLIVILPQQRKKKAAQELVLIGERSQTPALPYAYGRAFGETPALPYSGHVPPPPVWDEEAGMWVAQDPQPPLRLAPPPPVWDEEAGVWVTETAPALPEPKPAIPPPPVWDEEAGVWVTQDPPPEDVRHYSQAAETEAASDTEPVAQDEKEPETEPAPEGLHDPFAVEAEGVAQPAEGQKSEAAEEEPAGQAVSVKNAEAGKETAAAGESAGTEAELTENNAPAEAGGAETAPPQETGEFALGDEKMFENYPLTYSALLAQAREKYEFNKFQDTAMFKKVMGEINGDRAYSYKRKRHPGKKSGGETFYNEKALELLGKQYGPKKAAEETAETAADAARAETAAAVADTAKGGTAPKVTGKTAPKPKSAAKSEGDTAESGAAPKTKAAAKTAKPSEKKQ